MPESHPDIMTKPIGQRTVSFYKLFISLKLEYAIIHGYARLFDKEDWVIGSPAFNIQLHSASLTPETYTSSVVF